MIGLKRGTVKLVPHNPKWTELFEEEKQLLQNTFGDTIIAIEHIGSTAISNIPAKPIIDINLGVASLGIARDMKNQFEKLGYKNRPSAQKQLKWEELYVKGSEVKRTHYVHVTVYGNKQWENDVLFRDYLHKNPVRAKQYAALKERLAAKYADDRKTYTKNKEEFIIETLKMARKDLPLTAGQIKYLASIPDDKTIVIKPWNPRGLETANQIITEIKGLEPTLEILLVGSLPLKIAGQEDIDINAFCSKSEQPKHIDNFKKLFGEPTRIGKNSISWDFQKNGFSVSVWLTDPTADTTKAQITVFHLLKNNPCLLKEYEEIKNKTKSLSYKEYQRKKYEFYNRILRECVVS
ncbi:MAG: GrpB family protein [bacterium]